LSASVTTLHALRRGELAGATELRLSGLSIFPEEIFDLADTLELLDISCGSLSVLPPNFSRLKKLRVLFCSHNHFTHLPEILAECGALSQIGFRGNQLTHVPDNALPLNLRWLILTDNQLSSLPNNLGERPYLQKLMLAGNKLASLPDSMASATRLELLRLSANNFESLPNWLTQLPKLAWISWAGNPFEPAAPAFQSAMVPWEEINTTDCLGEGASGRVYRAHWRSPMRAAPQQVAVKLFKGSMTSDGMPQNEMAACLCAGSHPNVMSALGRLEGHPDDLEGLIMPLMPNHWRVLAAPPSLLSCSRDIYDKNLMFTHQSLLTILTSIASAAAHLHAQGILHGDLYGHNILWDGGDGRALLSDFGAACLLAQGREGKRWQRIETCAFGILIEELLSLSIFENDFTKKLHELKTSCLQPQTQERPLLADVATTLTQLARDFDVAVN